MNEKEQQKLKIRERYRGMDKGLAEVIPAKEPLEFNANVKRRVAVYVRVSTDNIEQTSSYELQKNYYENLVGKNPNWTLVGIYADEGISGTSLKHRDAFNRMIEDCEAGKIDMILTKNGSRFTRNVRDYTNTIGRLDDLPNPVGIYFESESMYSLKSENEMPLNFIMTMAQEESRIKSSVMNSSIEMRFSHGILLTPVLLGYDHDEDGNLIINEDEAQTVRLMFYMYLFGYNCEQISDELTRLGRRTKKGNEKWTSGAVLKILRNERYCGDVLARKTFTPNYKNHLSKKNRGDRNQYRWHNDHEPIIPRGDFIAVQHLLDNAKYKNKQIFPELKVTVEGPLMGFVSINPRWSAFKAEDYLNVSKRADNMEEKIEKKYVEAQKGEFDFRGYEIAGSKMFNISDKICATFSVNRIVFSIGSIRKLNLCKSIELMVHPISCMLAARPCSADYKNSMIWMRMNNMGRYVPKSICGTAFLKTVFELNKWNTSFKYRVEGYKLQNDTDSLLMFNLKEAVALVPKCEIDEEILNNKKIITSYAGKKYVPVMYSKNMDSFGNNYYEQLSFLNSIRQNGNWNCSEDVVTFSELENIDVSSAEDVEEKIGNIIDGIRGEE